MAAILSRESWVNANMPQTFEKGNYVILCWSQRNIDSISNEDDSRAVNIALIKPRFAISSKGHLIIKLQQFIIYVSQKR